MNPVNPFDATAPKFQPERAPAWSDPQGYSAILMRRLPSNTSQEALRSMLLFAKDFLSAEFVSQNLPEDKGYLTAIACFKTGTAAQEARAMLDGKPNTAGEATMIVEVISLTPGGSSRRGNLDQRPLGSSDSAPNSSNSQQPRQASKFNGTFQALDRVSPPHLSTFNNGEGSMKDSNSYQMLFSPQSPIGHPLERQRISGKSVIGEDAVDDDTGKLLNDPVAYAKNDMAGNSNGQGRRSTLPQLPTSRFSQMSLNSTAMTSPPLPSLASPRSGPLQSPGAFPQSGMSFSGQTSPYQMSNPHFTHPNFPPVNPADQNPPCNTLYVGNLPIDTSEDELKALFSKQRGYRRLCFRTKGNGPMCFVEFEDISFATKVLKDLYGYPLSNSVKGGIRLSFSKNPLGVRTGQSGNSGLPSPMSPHGPASGLAGYGGMPPFSATNGPPPGIPAPPGLLNTNSANNNGLAGLASPSSAPLAGGFHFPISPTSGAGAPGMRSPTSASGSNVWSGQSGNFSDYLTGR